MEKTVLVLLGFWRAWLEGPNQVCWDRTGPPGTWDPTDGWKLRICWDQDQFCNWQGPVSEESMGLFVQNRWTMWGWQQQSIKAQGLSAPGKVPYGAAHPHFGFPLPGAGFVLSACWNVQATLSLGGILCSSLFIVIVGGELGAFSETHIFGDVALLKERSLA